MKKRYFILSAILMLTVCLVPGCQQTSDKTVLSEETDKNVSDTANTDTKDVTADKQDNADQEPKESEPEKYTAVIYGFDEEGEVVAHQMEIGDEQDIWHELQKDGILTEECKILQFSRDEDTKKIELDFNKATGDRIRSMGTAGEIQIVGCIVNSYLETYGCDGIRLTEEGQAFESSHASYDGYSGIISFD